MPAALTLKDIAKEARVSFSYLERPISDQHVLDFAVYLTRYEEIAPYLGLKEEALEDIEQKSTLQLRRREALKRWKSEYAMRATYRNLLEALLKCSKADTAMKICRVLSEEEAATKSKKGATPEKNIPDHEPEPVYDIQPEKQDFVQPVQEQGARATPVSVRHRLPASAKSTLKHGHSKPMEPKESGASVFTLSLAILAVVAALVGAGFGIHLYTTLPKDAVQPTATGGGVADTVNQNIPHPSKSETVQPSKPVPPTSKDDEDATATPTEKAQCTEIKTMKDLKKLLEKVNEPREEMCRDLEISDTTCIGLKRSKEGLTVDNIALKYMEENPKACWENIILYLCEDVGNKRLAHEVAEERGRMTTIKHQNFVSSPLGNKGVTAVPGIGRAIGANLRAAGICTAQQLLGHYLINPRKFMTFMANFGGNSYHHGLTYNGISEFVCHNIM